MTVNYELVDGRVFKNMNEKCLSVHLSTHPSFVLIRVPC